MTANRVVTDHGELDNSGQVTHVDLDSYVNTTPWVVISGTAGAVPSGSRKLTAGAGVSFVDAGPGGNFTIIATSTTIEQKRLLFRRQNLNLINIATGSNIALLSVSLGTTPVNYAVVSHPLLVESTATGSLVALLSGSEGVYGSHSMALLSGSSVLTPKNLVVVRDAWTGLHLTGTNGRDVYGLLQIQSGSLTGDAFNDSTQKTQISFVEETIFNGTSSLHPVPTINVGGRTVQYSYISRTTIADVPEDAYLSNTIFLDVPESGASVATGSVITRTRFITGVKSSVPIGANVTFPTYLDAALGDYSSKNFQQQVEIHLNGVLLNPGTSVSNPNDVYPGISTLTGDLKFAFKLKSGSNISMTIY